MTAMHGNKVWLAGLLFAANVATQSGAPPRVRLHFDDPHFARQARAAVAEVWALAERCIGPLDDGKAGTVHVYNDLVACQAVSERHRQGWSRRSHGFVLPKQRVAHVLFYRCGWCDDARWRIGELTMRLALHRAALPEREWPALVEHGLTCYAEGPTVTPDGVFVEPRNHGTARSDSRQRLQLLLQEGKLPEFSVHEPMGLRRAGLVALCRQRMHFLMREHPQATCAALRAALATSGRAQAEAALLRSLREQLGEAAFAGLDEAFAGYVEQLPKRMNIEVYPPYDAVGMLGAPEHVPGSPSILWLDKNRKSRFTLTAKPHLLQTGQADLAFECRGGERVRVTLEGDAQRGCVSVWRRRMKGGVPDGWIRLAATERDVAGLRLGRQVDLKVVADRRELRVSIDGVEVLAATLRKGSLAGRYGVGGPFANQVAWRSVRLR